MELANIDTLIQKIAIMLARQNDKILLYNLGIGYSQYKILNVLQASTGIKQKQIAIQLGQTEASISRQIKIMYGDGLLQATPQPEDHRVHLATLTTRGKRICDDAQSILKNESEKLLNQFSDQEQDTLIKILKRIQDFLEY